jgi:hypothetical protein
MRKFLLCLGVCLLALPALAQKPTTPLPGSALRKATLDGVRPTVEKALRKKVVFKVERLRVSGSWAFMIATPLNAKEKPIAVKDTPFREESDSMDGLTVYALLKKQKNGKWTVKAHAIGPTDVCWDGWDKEFGAPRSLFPYTN